MRILLIAAGLIALPLAAHAFDIDAYCQQVGAAAGGSAQLEAACREQEQRARNNISHMTVSPRVMDYCQGVGQSAGGSYEFTEQCLREEAKSGDKLD